MQDNSKLVIGTAQFGMDYGISNQTGKVKYSDVKDILNFAYLNKISFVDTARSYGDSESVLAQYFNENYIGGLDCYHKNKKYFFRLL